MHCVCYFSNTGKTTHYSFLPQFPTSNTYLLAKFQQKPCCRLTSNTLDYVHRSPKISSFYALFWLLLKYRYAANYSFRPRFATHNSYSLAKFQQKPCCRLTSNTLDYVRRSPKISIFYALFWPLLKYRKTAHYSFPPRLATHNTYSHAKL